MCRNGALVQYHYITVRLATTATSTGSDRARSVDEHNNAHDSDMDSNGDDSNTLEQRYR